MFPRTNEKIPCFVSDSFWSSVVECIAQNFIRFLSLCFIPIDLKKLACFKEGINFFLSKTRLINRAALKLEELCLNYV